MKPATKARIGIVMGAVVCAALATLGAYIVFLFWLAQIGIKGPLADEPREVYDRKLAIGGAVSTGVLVLLLALIARRTWRRLRGVSGPA